jgi:hypothetical protein
MQLSSEGCCRLNVPVAGTAETLCVVLFVPPVCSGWPAPLPQSSAHSTRQSAPPLPWSKHLAAVAAAVAAMAAAAAATAAAVAAMAAAVAACVTAAAVLLVCSDSLCRGAVAVDAGQGMLLCCAVMQPVVLAPQPRVAMAAAAAVMCTTSMQCALVCV